MGLFQWLKETCLGSWQPTVHIPDASHAPQVRRRYRFSGLVQGVGFRYEAKLLASQLSLTGWAQNKSDGTVVVELEGAESCITEFLRVMRVVPRFDITDIQVEELPLSGGETDFKVLY